MPVEGEWGSLSGGILEENPVKESNKQTGATEADGCV